MKWVAPLVGAFVGAAVALALTAGSGVAAQEPVTTTTTAGADSEPVVFVDERETIIGPAAIVPGGLTLDDDELEFRYELYPLAPTDGAEPVIEFLGFGNFREVAPDDIVPVWPVRWTLESSAGDVAYESTIASSRTVRFLVSDSFTVDQVTGIRLDSYRVRMPLDDRFTVTEGPAYEEIAPGLRIRLLRRVVQGDQTIVQVEVDSAVPDSIGLIAIEGYGGGWLSAVRAAEGGPRWNLRYDGSDLPAEIPLVVRGSVWIDIEQPTPVELGAIG